MGKAANKIKEKQNNDNNPIRNLLFIIILLVELFANLFVFLSEIKHDFIQQVFCDSHLNLFDVKKLYKNFLKQY
jgi:hypothetical protein